MLVNVNKLKGAALDWAVAKSLYGDRVVHYKTWLETENKYWKGSDCSFASNLEFRILSEDRDGVTTAPIKPYSIDWAQGGPIIEREGIELLCNMTADEAARWTCGGVHASWQAFYRDKRGTDERSYATTPLVAAMRCYVAAKFGNKIDIPEELVNDSI